MKREGEQEEKKVRYNSWREAGLGQGARVVEKKGKPGMDCQRKQEEGE